MFTVISIKLAIFWFYNSVMRPKDADVMVNSVDPDQTASLGEFNLGLSCLPKTSLSRYIEYSGCIHVSGDYLDALQTKRKKLLDKRLTQKRKS